ncbi:unnamed protein product [Leptidea sinapis]|uniref:Uncharacterized protein n=1 Tax=Leptidea sinapis TaxID=189913 RepID=A0A5E4PXM0_9NEOP|nr:unnamed protein product [Leptidea sinapis]
MLSAAIAALACLCLARTSPPDTHPFRAYALYTPKDLSSILANIDERLRMLDTMSEVQAKQARKLDVIQDKLDRVETTLSLRLERAQLAAERLEHRLHMLQTSIQAAVKESSEKIERSQAKIVEIASNLTNHINSHSRLLDKVSGTYADTWRRSLLLESLMRDGMSLMQEVLDTQKRFVDSCQRVQLDDPTHVADVLDKLIDSLINNTMRNHDNRVMKLLNSRPTQSDATTCKRLENALRNTTHVFNEKELQQLTDKFIGLTNRADAALQKLEGRLSDEAELQLPE